MAVSRRDLLKAFLGLPMLAACRGESSPHLPEGELVYPSQQSGHRLRERPRMMIPLANRLKMPVIILGAGVSGLSAAWRFQRAGFEDFLLLENDAMPGGTAKYGVAPQSMYPWGAHYSNVPMRENRAYCRFLEEVGSIEGYDADGHPIVAEHHLCREPEERVYYRGRWYEGLYLHAGESTEDQADLVRFLKEIEKLAAWRDDKGKRAFAIPMSMSSEADEIRRYDQISFATWFSQQGFRSKRLYWLLDYACRDDYGTRIEDTSAWAGLFYFAARQGENGRESQQIITWPEGNGKLVRHMSVRLARKISMNRMVLRLQTVETPEGPRIAIDAIDHQKNIEEGYLAEQVVFALPQFQLPYLLEDEHRATLAKSFAYSAWMVANLHLRKPPAGLGFPLCWDNVFYESPSLGYVMAGHQQGISPGPAVATYYYPLCDIDTQKARERLLSLGRDEWAEVCLSDMERAHPKIRDNTERLDVIRWGHAMIRPSVGFLFGGAREKAAEPLGGFYFAHSDLSGLPLFEEAFSRGTSAAEQIMTARGHLFGAL